MSSPMKTDSPDRPVRSPSPHTPPPRSHFSPVVEHTRGWAGTSLGSPMHLDVSPTPLLFPHQRELRVSGSDNGDSEIDVVPVRGWEIDDDLPARLFRVNQNGPALQSAPKSEPQAPDFDKPAPLEGRTTLYQLLCAPLPKCPPDYSRADGTTVLDGTKKGKPKKLPAKKQLLRIVYVRDTFEDILAELKPQLESEELTIDWSNPQHRDWALQIFPFMTRRGLAKRIRSEKDVELRVWTSIFNPALTAVLAVRLGKIPLLSDDSMDPYLGSAIQKKTGAIPDFLLVDGIHPNEDIPLRGEIKCQHVLKPIIIQKTPRGNEIQDAEQVEDEWEKDPDVEDEVDAGDEADAEDEADVEDEGTVEESSGGVNNVGDGGVVRDEDDARDDNQDEVHAKDEGEDQDDEESVEGVEGRISPSHDEEVEGKHIFEILQAYNQHFERGNATRFIWPSAYETQSKLTKLPPQLWDQLIEAERKGDSEARNFISSYEWTTFVARRYNNLYISDNYGVNDDVILYAVCMIAHSLGVTDAGLRLPKPRTQWWPQGTREKTWPTGVVAETLPQYAKAATMRAAEE
ncbi:hypothetical protein NM688_g3868 [Phlebia brevispora]|uniref:Uncharacterized protein n=1 Tax=Phlebia brevispora TaxID=194682 RepID=A0ACC1T487_9APHY|nr:hypothetical protein NM688_g3868 [Phlebia brevispora]